MSNLCRPVEAASCNITADGCGSLAVCRIAAPSSCTAEGIIVNASYSAETKPITVPVPQTADLEANVKL